MDSQIGEIKQNASELRQAVDEFRQSEFAAYSGKMKLMVDEIKQMTKKWTHRGE
jgi:hypothetical protein